MFPKEPTGLIRVDGRGMIRTGEKVNGRGGRELTPAGRRDRATAIGPRAHKARSSRFPGLAAKNFMAFLEGPAADALRNVSELLIGLRLRRFHRRELGIPLVGVVGDLGFQIGDLGGDVGVLAGQVRRSGRQGAVGPNLIGDVGVHLRCQTAGGIAEQGLDVA